MELQLCKFNSETRLRKHCIFSISSFTFCLFYFCARGCVRGSVTKRRVSPAACRARRACIDAVPVPHVNVDWVIIDRGCRWRPRAFTARSRHGSARAPHIPAAFRRRRPLPMGRVGCKLPGVDRSRSAHNKQNTTSRTKRKDRTTSFTWMVRNEDYSSQFDRSSWFKQGIEPMREHPAARRGHHGSAHLLRCFVCRSPPRSMAGSPQHRRGVHK